MGNNKTKKHFYFDDPRTLELHEIVRAFLNEKGVGIAIYKSSENEEEYMYSLIGFDTIAQKAKYIWGRQTEDIPLGTIHSLNDALIALSNVKLHAKCMSFELYVIFDDKTGDVSVEFFKDDQEPEQSFTRDARTIEIVELIRSCGNAEVGLMIYPQDKEMKTYLCKLYDFVETDSGRKIVFREGMEAIPLKEIKSFDDALLAITNAKVHDCARRFEIFYGKEKKFGLPALMFAKT